MDPVTLSTERLLLRPFEPDDIEAVRVACQDPEIPRWTTVPSPYTEDHARDFVTVITVEGWRDDVTYNFGLFTRDGGALAGTMGLVRLTGLRTAQRQAELGYWTAADQRRRGYATEAAREICRWAFTDLGVERLEWCAETGNVASRSVALKAGFRMEGVRRSQLLHNGTRRDAWWGALLPSDVGIASHTPYLPYEEA